MKQTEENKTHRYRKQNDGCRGEGCERWKNDKGQ